MSHEEEAEEESDSDSDAETRPSGTLEEYSKRAQGKITNCDVLTRGKGLLNLKVMDACPKRIGAGWNTIYTYIRQKLDAIYKTKQELELDLSTPLEEQDPIIKLNLFSKKERKNVDDLHDYFKSTKRLLFVDLPSELDYCTGELLESYTVSASCRFMQSIDEGPFQMGTFRETLTKGTEGAPHLGPERPRVYCDLSPEDKERYNADIRATNILLQGLPKDIYSLINHYTDAKDIWDNVKMLLEGSELTKEDHESQLYDDFEHFRQNKGETIHDYYVRFAKLINDMRNIKMTMSRMQLNFKFVNNMLPEWGRFITAMKLNRGLRDYNYD
ncbi:hypothetical protein Tco_0667276 [Tanacetum coccineum]